MLSTAAGFPAAGANSLKAVAATYDSSGTSRITVWPRSSNCTRTVSTGGGIGGSGRGAARPAQPALSKRTPTDSDDSGTRTFAVSAERGGKLTRNRLDLPATISRRRYDAALA